MKNYYLILGVSPDASPEQIKSAYRKEAKRCHPDMSGEGSEPFLALHEAYEVLGDADQRRAYDERLASQARRYGRPASSRRLEPLGQRRCPVEPLVPDRQQASSRQPLHQSSNPFVSSPFPDERQNTSPLVRGDETLLVDVPLSYAQARLGGRLWLRLPVREWCPSCHGDGRAGWFLCPDCAGAGTVTREIPFEIDLPPGIRDGTAEKLSFRLPGRQSWSVILRFRVFI